MTPPSSLSASDASMQEHDHSRPGDPQTRPEPGLSIAIGIVLFNNPPDELASLTRTLHRAIARLVESEASAHSQRPPVFSIHLHNNGDGPIDREAFGPQAQLTSSATNIGFGRAQNHLMGRAFADGAEFYLALNPDAMLHPDALVEMVSVARRNKGRALVEAAQFPEELPKNFDPLTLDTPWASGCCLLIPSAIHAAIGGFDENMFLYCEDVDLSWRARDAGYLVKHAPRALCCHLWNRGGGSRVTKQTRLNSAHYLSKKWRNEAFARKVERDIAAQGWEPGPVPKLAPVEYDYSIADFSHDLSFFSSSRDGCVPYSDTWKASACLTWLPTRCPYSWIRSAR